MWTPGPFEARPLRAYYYITDVDPSWPAERQEEHLRDFNYGALWAISMHEVFPGHFLHYQHLRQVDVEAAQVDPVLVDRVRRRLGALLRADDGRGGLPQAAIHAVRLGQLAEALIRLCRLIVGIRLHCEDLSVEQGVRFFRDEAFLEEAQRAPRGRARDVRSRPTCCIARQADGAEAAGGLQGARRRAGTRCAGSTTRCSATAPCPLWLHRSLMLGENNGDYARNRAARFEPACPLYEYECDACSTASSGSRSSPIRRSTSARRAARAGHASCSRRPRSSSRDPAATSPTTRRSPRPTPAKTGPGEKLTESVVDIEVRLEVGVEHGLRARPIRARRRRREQHPSSQAPPASRRHEVELSGPAGRSPTLLEIDRAQVVAERHRRGPGAAARSRRPPSGSPACCRCRGGRRRCGSRRSAATSAAAAGRWSAGFRRCDPSPSLRAPGRCRA